MNECHLVIDETVSAMSYTECWLLSVVPDVVALLLLAAVAVGVLSFWGGIDYTKTRAKQVYRDAWAEEQQRRFEDCQRHGIEYEPAIYDGP